MWRVKYEDETVVVVDPKFVILQTPCVIGHQFSLTPMHLCVKYHRSKKDAETLAAAMALGVVPADRPLISVVATASPVIGITSRWDDRRPARQKFMERLREYIGLGRRNAGV